MTLPLRPPLAPQLARSSRELPEGPGWAYERKWDGFRALAFVDGEEVVLRSRNDRPLTRYFPEVRFPPGRYVLDGELVVLDASGREDFAALGQRIHPADSRVEQLAAQTPATYVAFDLLARDDDVLLECSYDERRAALENLVGEPVVLTDVVREPAAAQRWLQEAEGVVAKETGAPYRPGKRAGMVKVKRERTIDAVVMGWRPGKERGTVGALILGLYEPDGTLREVGHSSGFTARQKRELVDLLAPYGTGEHGSAEPSRWRADHELEWVALRPELVTEVRFDHVSAGRIRHGTKVLRWREDKDPQSCTIDQLDAD